MQKHIQKIKKKLQTTLKGQNLFITISVTSYITHLEQKYDFGMKNSLISTRLYYINYFEYPNIFENQYQFQNPSKLNYKRQVIELSHPD